MREKYPRKEHLANLLFKIQDVQKLAFKGKFDIIFSSFALQWIENKNLFFQKAYKALKKDGTLAMIVPTGVSPELEQAVHTLISLPFDGENTFRASIRIGFFLIANRSNT